MRLTWPLASVSSGPSLPQTTMPPITRATFISNETRNAAPESTSHHSGICMVKPSQEFYKSGSSAAIVFPRNAVRRDDHTVRNHRPNYLPDHLASRVFEPI